MEALSPAITKLTLLEGAALLIAALSPAANSL